MLKLLLSGSRPRVNLSWSTCIKAVLSGLLSFSCFSESLSAYGASLGPTFIPDLASVKQGLKQSSEKRKWPWESESDAHKETARTEKATSKKSAFDKIMDEGNAALNTGDTDRAIRIFQSAEKFYPTKIEPFIGIARAYYILGEENKALKLLDSIQDRFPLYPELYATRGNLYFSLGKMNEAREQFYIALTLNSDDSATCFRLAQIALLNYSAQEAIFYLKPALILNPSNNAARVLLARLEWQAGRLADAQREMEEACMLDPKNPVLASENALLLLEAGKTLEALETLLQAYKLDPESAEIQKQLMTVYAVRQDWASAQDAASAWVQLEPGNPKAFLAKSWCQLMNREFDDATNTLKEALELAPKDSEIHNIYGLTLCERRKFDEALKEFSTSASLEQDYLPALLNKASVLGIQGQYDQAIAYLSDLESDYPENQDRLALKAYLEARAGRWKDLERTLSAFDSKSSNTLIMIAKAIMLGHQGNLDESVAVLRSAAKSAPTNPSTLCQLSLSLLECGKIDESMEIAQQALQLAPNNLEAKSALAYGLAKAKNYDGAILLLKECVSRLPKDEKLRVTLAETQLARGDLYMAETTYQRAYALFPANYQFPLGLAKVAAEQKQFSRAVELADEAILLAPAQAQAYSQKAGYLYALGKAQAVLDTLSSLSAESQTADDKLLKAKAYLMLAKYAKALANFEEAKRMNAKFAQKDNLSFLKTCIAANDIASTGELIKALNDDEDSLSSEEQLEFRKLKHRYERIHNSENRRHR